MGAYHQMGHDSENIVRDVGGYDGAVLSPVNETKDRVRRLLEEHSSSGLEFIFDPQLYFPKNTELTV